jgi:hypothetical protein
MAKTKGIGGLVSGHQIPHSQSLNGREAYCFVLGISSNATVEKFIKD